MKIRWILGFAVGIYFLVIGLYPQIDLWRTRGPEYNGVYAFNDLDETAYAAYLQALIDGRPRRNNPYTGTDDSVERRLPESLFSIQFIPPYLASIPARMFGINASTAFILIGAVSAFAAATTVFCFFLLLTNNAFFAAVATLVTLCGGAIIIGEGAFIEMVGGQPAYPYFPFLRRYIPAIPFPVFWLFCAAAWQTVVSTDLSKRIWYSLLTAVCFAFLVYSYFYLWTSAAAWLVCLAIVWLIFQPPNWKQDLQAFGTLLILAVITLVPYVLMLINRDRTMDDVQLLVKTHNPDFVRPPEILSFLTLVLLCFAIWRKTDLVQNKSVLFTMSLALVPFVVFNQQIITGQSLQPIHYQVFIANYIAFIAFVTTFFLIWRENSEILPRHFGRLVLSLAALAAVTWGAIEASYTTAVIKKANLVRDQAVLASNRLRERTQSEFSKTQLAKATVLPINLLQGDDLPIFTQQGVLWARHQHVFAGETALENKQRFYHFLYFAGVDKNNLSQQLHERNVITVITLFGWDKLTTRLSANPQLLSEEEITEEVDRYANFWANFNAEEAANWQFSYVIVSHDSGMDFTNVDRWYERETGEDLQGFTLYRVKLREN